MRSFHGDLRYEPEPGGARFNVDLLMATSENEEEAYDAASANPAGGRPQSVQGRA